MDDMLITFLFGIHNEIELDFTPNTEFEEDELFDPLFTDFESAVEEMVRRHPEIQDYIDSSYQSLFIVLGDVRELTEETLRVKILNSIYSSFEAGETFEEWKEMIFSTGKFNKDDAYFKTVYRQNIFNSYNAGLYEQQERNINLKPYGLFDAVGDDRTTEICNQNNGLIYPINHPWWNTNYPPLHFNCRSERIALSMEDMKDNNLNTSTIGQMNLNQNTGAKPQEGFGGNPYDPNELEKQIKIKKDEAYNMFLRLGGI